MAAMSMQLLDLGRLTVDDGFFLTGSGCSTLSNPSPGAVRREIAVIAAVIEHPKVGPILFETGCAQNAEEVWPEPAWDAFPMTTYEKRHHLDVALADAGYAIGDIKAVVMGHMHLDHAGGLTHFLGSDIPIYVHEQELREQWFAIASRQGLGPYVPSDLHWQLNWQPIASTELEIFSGITLRHMPGHTPGLMTMQVELPNCGHFFLASDLFHIREQYEGDLAQGWLLGDRTSWWRSRIWMSHLVGKNDGTIVYGHDATVLEDLKRQAKVFD